MGLIEVRGDIFRKELDMIIHIANCQMTMGAGIAGQIKRKYPEAYQADVNFNKPKGKARLGYFSGAKIERYGFYIVNLYGQETFGRENKRYVDYEAVEEGLDRLFDLMEEKGKLKTLKVGCPKYMGCNLAGGDWNVMEKILRDLSDRHGIDIVVCEF